MTTIAIDPEAPPLRVDETGTIRVGQTRVTLDIVVWAHWHGDSPEKIASDYDTLTLPDVYGAIAYYLRHHDVLDPYLEQREREAEQMRIQAQSQPGYKELTEPILRRARERGLR